MIFYFLVIFFLIFLIYCKKRTKIQHIGNHAKISYLKRSDLDKLSKIPNLIVVIGSGPGSLTCAALLSSLQYKLIVLEQHDRIGGTLHTFEREKKWKFETGLHYVGKSDTLTTKILNFLFSNQILENLWIKLPQVYDQIYFTQKGQIESTFQFRETYQNFELDLSTQFPEDIPVIQEVLKDIQKASNYKLSYIFKFLPLWLTTVFHFLFFYQSSEMTITFSDYLTQKIKNSKLRNLFCSQFANYGFSPETCPFGFAASVIDHYCRGGAYYPTGGPNQLAQKFANIILEEENPIFICCKVQNIQVGKNGQVEGIFFSNNTRNKNFFYLPCEKIICGTNRFTLMDTLLTKEIREMFFKSSYTLIQKELKPDVEFIFLFIGLKQYIPLPRHNIWHLPNLSTSEYLNPYMNDPFTYSDCMPVFLGSGSAKEDMDGLGNSLVVITFGRKEWFSPTHTSEYLDEKKEWEKKLFKIVEIYLPHIKKEIEFSEIGTPLTYQYYFNTSNAYGIAMNCNRYKYMDKLHPETSIKNLYCTGQDTCTLGFTGALQSGFMTAVRIHGISLFLRVLIQNKPRFTFFS